MTQKGARPGRRGPGWGSDTLWSSRRGLLAWRDSAGQLAAGWLGSPVRRRRGLLRFPEESTTELTSDSSPCFSPPRLGAVKEMGRDQTGPRDQRESPSSSAAVDSSVGLLGAPTGEIRVPM